MVSPDEPRALGFAGAPGTTVSVHLDETNGWISVSGELEVETAPVFAGVIEGHLHHDRVDLCLDLSEVTFFDLAGFGALCAAQQQVEAAGGRLRVVRAGALLRTVGELFGHGDLFESAPVPRRPSRPVGRGEAAGPSGR